MARIKNIKQKILQLDPGTFQNLCDYYLCKKGYSNIVSLGSEAGTWKTTPGTPDTYFITSDEKYIFAEYTTQQANLFKKIKNDIAKCLDTSTTGINYDKISEIIYCHTSSNITPSQDMEIRNLCNKVGINLTIIGIDELAEDINANHHDIALDFLEIPIGTEQVLSYDDFIKSYNRNLMAAPIDTEFLFRDKEIKLINEKYEKCDIIILSGVAGVGKTRLALQYARNHSETNNEKLYCIHNKDLPIYEDLKIFIDTPCDYFIFIDDANQLSGLEHIIRYTTKKSEGYSVKLLITVRDYALQKVKNDICEIASYDNIKVESFTDDEIKKLLETTLEIFNRDYQERIIIIAEGNARIAILAGKIALSSNSLYSIADVSQLYENYYGASLKKQTIFNDNKMYITAGIIAFLGAIHLDYIDPLIPISDEKGINGSCFIENTKILHDNEIVDIYNDKAVRFSDQCMSNYMLKHVFYDKKLISLSAMIKTCFQTHKERTISAVKTLINIFKNEDIISFLKKELKILWDELSQKESPIFLDFIKVFFGIAPLETLLILQREINSEKNAVIEWFNIDTETGKNNSLITDHIIEILGGFAEMSDFPAALDLFFQYYLKRPDLYIQFYHAINRYFGIFRASVDNEFNTQIELFEKMIEYSSNWEKEYIVVLFLEVAKVFLKLYFSPIEGGRHKTFTMYQIPLEISEGVEKYRELIWESIFSICKIDKYKNNVKKVLESYGSAMIEDISFPILQYDLPFIKPILESYFPKTELSNCILASKLLRIFKRRNISCESLFAGYFEETKFHLYNLLCPKDLNFIKDRQLKHQRIDEFISNCDFIMFKKLIDVCDELNSLDGIEKHKITEGLSIAFEIIYDKKDYYVDAVKYYIEKDTPGNMHPNRLINNIFSLLSDSEVFSLINNNEYCQKNTWLYWYYHELPTNLITDKHLKGLYIFLEDTSDMKITSTAFRDLDFLDKYSLLDERVFIEGCKIILTKMKYSPFIVHVYFNLFFINSTAQTIIHKFTDNLDLLEEIYFIMLSIEKSHDHEGALLKELYLLKPSVLEKYIDYVINKNNYSYDYQESILCFYDLDNFLEIYNEIFELLIKEDQVLMLILSHFMEVLFLPNKENDLLDKQDQLIRGIIQKYYEDKTKMYWLFSIIPQLINARRKEYIWLFLDYNTSFHDFEKIPLIDKSFRWVGSEIPIYSAQVEFLESLLPDFTGLKWINHKNHIKTIIDNLKKRIETIQIQDILRG